MLIADTIYLKSIIELCKVSSADTEVKLTSSTCYPEEGSISDFDYTGSISLTRTQLDCFEQCI